MGKTIAEKILSARAGQDVKAGDIVFADVDLVMSHDGNKPLASEVFEQLGGERVFEKDKVIQVIDHRPSLTSEVAARTHQKMREFCSRHGIRLFEAGSGIMHQVVGEAGLIVPGDLVIGTDSHTCTYGALNAFSTGVGVSDLAAAMITGKLWFRVPQSVYIDLQGTLPPGVFSKDLGLYLLGMLGANGATYKALEFHGEGLRRLSVDARFTLTNLAVEFGAKAGLMPADDVILSWLEGRTERPLQPVDPDPDAAYEQRIAVDLSSLEPQVALPHRPDNAVPVSEAEGTPIAQAVIGTCTNGRLEDLRIAARILKGKRVHPGVRLFVAPASRDVYLTALREGIVETLVAAGADFGISGCTFCTGGAGLGIPADGTNMITTANRNFRGRTGNPAAFIYLASPATVAASALEGRIVDPRRYVKEWA